MIKKNGDGRGGVFNIFFSFPQDLEELDPDFIMAKQVEQLEKEKKELQERLKNQEKKVRK